MRPVRITEFRWARCLLILALGCWCLPVFGAEEPSPEAHAWGVATRLFQSAAFDVAERELQAFAQAYTNSPKIPESLLLLGQCRFQQRNYEGALSLLQERLPGAGDLADQYRLWTAESLFRLGRFEEAAREYAGIVDGFPGSARRLDALVGQAYALFRGGKAREAFELLAKPDGLFLGAAAARGGDDLVVRGYLLLGEAALACGQSAAAEPLLLKMQAPPRPELDWQRQYLLARVQAGAQRLDAAGATVETLLNQLGSVTNSAVGQYRADARALSGEILEKRGDLAGALRAQEQNLATGVPPVRRQEAGAQVARLALLSLKSDAASNLLESVLARYGGDVVVDPVRVAQAEVLLQRYFGLPEEARSGASALVARSAQLVGGVLTNAPGAWTARAQLAAGWCGWEESQRSGNLGRLGESLAAFQAAAATLPKSGEQAIARFKSGDCFLALTNYAAALTNYWLAATNYVDTPAASQGIADHALYQVVHAATLSGDLAQAEQAMGRLLDQYPGGFFGEEGVMAYAQALGRLGKTADERKLYVDFLQRFGGSARAAQVGLAVARTWQQEGKWSEAAAEYDKWLAANPTHALRGKAEYERAWCVYRAGDEARAFTLYSEFLQKFPGDPLAASARYWVAGFYFNRGDYLKAEGEYQRVFLDTNGPASELPFHARLMAGRSAYGRTSYREARNYLLDLLNTNCPADLLPEAWFELGRTIWKGADATNMLESLDKAINAFSRIPTISPSSRRVPEAWMQMGKCHFQLGTAEPKEYDKAMAAYTNVLTSALADVALRSEAEVGLAKVLEKKAAAASAVDRTGLQAEALARYLAVTEGGNLRPGESADPVWVEQAGLGGAVLAEEMQRWDVAEKLYLRLMDLAPPLRKKFQFRLDQLRARRAQLDGAGA